MATANRVAYSHTAVPPRFPPLTIPATVITTTATTYTVQPQDSIIIFTSSNADVTITLPTNSPVGRVLYFTMNANFNLLSASSNITQSDNTVSDLIAGQGDWCTLVYSGNDIWYKFMQY